MQIERLEASQIERATYNPRVVLVPSDPEWQEIEKSLDAFGLVQPLVWNQRSGRLVGGHRRMDILEARGHTAFDVSVVDLDDVQEKLLNIALNNPGGRWDDDKLAAMVRSLSDEANWLATGFDNEEVNRILRQDDIRHSTDFLDDTLNAPGSSTSPMDSQVASQRSELFSMSFPLGEDQRELVQKRLNEIKRAQQFATLSEALVFLCRL